MKALQAGIAYFAMVFAAGFMLGIVRVMLLAPNVGETLAVAIELPIMLAVSWISCSMLIDRYSVSG
ncbi:MAG: hypothetical protein Q9M29_00840, partial [Mariprofundaceae bacterium]|nr:hypothetical protein [Mariprofundaceae bacterium]